MATGSLNIGTANSLSTTYATTGYYVDGVKVLGAQLTAVANVSNTDTATADGINAILGVLRAHGLIAT